MPVLPNVAGEAGSATASNADPRLAQYKIIRRNGAVVGFEPAKISIAMTKAFLAVNGGQGAASARIRDEVARLTELVVRALMKRKPEGGAIHIEEIQDQVEQPGHHLGVGVLRRLRAQRDQLAVDIAGTADQQRLGEGGSSGRLSPAAELA